MAAKRALLPSAPSPSAASSTPPPKRRRTTTTTTTTTTPPGHPPPSAPASRDRLTRLSDELLLRVLSFLPLPHLLFSAAPVSRRLHALAADAQLWRALYYARFVLPRALRIPGLARATAADAQLRLHRAGRRALWADGRRGAVLAWREDDGAGRGGGGGGGVDWKRQYRIRHNWARGACAVEELRMGQEGVARGDAGAGGPKMLVKIVEGVAITADRWAGLRVWDLKSKRMLVRALLGDAAPSCIAVDDSALGRGIVAVAVGFKDGSFGIWRLHTEAKQLDKRYGHERCNNGALVAMALSYPYLLTATESVLVSLYTFAHQGDPGTPGDSLDPTTAAPWPPPHQLTSLGSHTSKPPLALAIRRLPTATVASIAYTFTTWQGWCIGIQNLHVAGAAPTTTRLAYTPPGPPGRAAGPTALSYTHPYLLATLPDNTLLLHLCTAGAAGALSVAPGLRLWGHTSGIGDADITARGRAVSVSARGGEVRVWDLEGGGGRGSVEVRPGEGGAVAAGEGWDERRDWVGFDDEMVLVLKEGAEGRESLVVYDFT